MIPRSDDGLPKPGFDRDAARDATPAGWLGKAIHGARAHAPAADSDEYEPDEVAGRKAVKPFVRSAEHPTLGDDWH